MEKIVQLGEYEYNKLSDLAKLNESQIEEKALEMYKTKGVAGLKITVKMANDEYSYEHHFDCSTFIWYKDEKFFISEKLRDRLEKYIKERVLDEIVDKYGEPIKWFDRFSKEIRGLRLAKYTIWTIAVSGWAAFAGCLVKLLI